MGQQPTLLGGQWFERPADSLSLWFMGGVSGSCGLALPSKRQCIVSHNSLQPLSHVGSDLQAVLITLEQYCFFTIHTIFHDISI